MCLENVECKEVIINAWTGRDRRDASVNICSKLDSCRRSNIRWRKELFGNNQVELRKAKEEF